MSIVFREGLKIPPAALNDIISAANHDIRQVSFSTDAFQLITVVWVKHLASSMCDSVCLSSR